MFMIRLDQRFVYPVKCFKVRYGLHPAWKLDVAIVMTDLLTDLANDPLLTLGAIAADTPERRNLLGMLGQTAKEACEVCWGRACLDPPTSWTYTSAKDDLKNWRCHESFKDPSSQGLKRVSPLTTIDEIIPSFDLHKDVPLDEVSDPHCKSSFGMWKDLRNILRHTSVFFIRSSLKHAKSGKACGPWSQCN